MPSPNGTLPILDVTAALTRPTVQLVEERLGRPLRGRFIEQDIIARIRPPGLGRLRTRGPVTVRQVIVEDSQPPHLTVAVSWALIVAARVPEPLLLDFHGFSGEPLDRLLTAHGVRWRGELTDDGVATSPAGEASARFAWATRDTPLLELTRILSVGGNPLAVAIDEVPLLPRLGATAPLLALNE
jgi:hypothetical protein